MTKIVTSAVLVQLIKTHGAAKVISRAIVAIYGRQTAEEKSGEATIANNGVGFTAYDARVGTLTAKHWLATNSLEPWMINYWMKETKQGYPKICRYAKQLDQIAKANRSIQSGKSIGPSTPQFVKTEKVKELLEPKIK